MHFWFPEPFYFNEEIFINGYVSDLVYILLICLKLLFIGVQ